MKCVFGTMEFARRLNPENSRIVIQKFLKKFKELDTAEMYSDTQSESILGQNISVIQKLNGVISTKINPAANGYQPEIFENRFKKCLERLKLDCVDILYLHWPCNDVPLLPLIDKIDELHKKKLFKRFGISNYPAWEVAKIVEYCRSKGYIQPSVYQGMYNCLTRDVERELIPCLREYNIAFYAYNPLAGGILTGRYKYEDREKFDDKTKCRFHGLPGGYCQKYQDRFWHKSYFDALDKLYPLLGNLTPLQISYSWLCHHSKLSSEKGDAVIIGASSIEQFDQNMEAFENAKPLSQPIIDSLDESYKIIKGSQPSYFR